MPRRPTARQTIRRVVVRNEDDVTAHDLTTTELSVARHNSGISCVTASHRQSRVKLYTDSRPLTSSSLHQQIVWINNGYDLFDVVSDPSLNWRRCNRTISFKNHFFVFIKSSSKSLDELVLSLLGCFNAKSNKTNLVTIHR